MLSLWLWSGTGKLMNTLKQSYRKKSFGVHLKSFASKEDDFQLSLPIGYTLR